MAAARRAELVVRNSVPFRAANEKLKAAAEELGVRRVLFICECPDKTCTRVVRLDLSEYEAIRSHPTRFLTVKGHEVSAGTPARVVEEHDTYTVVAMAGEAAKIVTELDPRSPSPRNASP